MRAEFSTRFSRSKISMFFNATAHATACPPECQQVRQPRSVFLELGVQCGTNHGCRDRQIAAGHAFGHDENVRDGVEVLGRKQPSRAAPTIDDLVHDEQDAILIANAAYLLPVVDAGDVAAGRRADRLCNERGHRLGT